LRLIGVLKKILYSNDENNFVIAVLEDNTKICGNYFDTDINKLIGEEIELIGDWTTHQTYGLQFEFESIKINKNEFLFFLSKVVKGLGHNIAKEILNRYSEEELVNILDNKPKELLKFKGIREKKLSQIISSWNQYKHLRELAKFLGEYGVSTAFINKIYQSLNEVDNLIAKIKQNPYILTNVTGIGFKRADEIAIKMGIAKDNIFRLESGILYICEDYFNNYGNSSILSQELIQLSKELLEVDEGLIQDSILSLLNKQLLKEVVKDKITLPH